MAFKQEHFEYILEDQKNNPSAVIAIVGPTCTGKTDLSIALAQELSLPVINADSRLIYAEMNIGTAKPSQQELAMASHYLINIRKPNESYSAGDYRDDFDKTFSTLMSAKAIAVGGTGLYIRAALEDLQMPEVSRDDVLRKELQQKGLDELLFELDRLDSNARELIDVNNKIRIIRAIEILRSSNKPLSELRKRSSESRYHTAFYGLNFRKREILYALIDKRVELMIERGLLEEVAGLLERYGVTQTMLATIGYKEIIAYLQNQCSLEEAIDLIQQRTRNYAKKQITWFKTNKKIHWLYHD